MSGNPKYDQLMVQKKQENQHTMIKIKSVLKVVRIYEWASEFQAIRPMGSENAWKPQIWPVALIQSGANIRKINRPWPKSI